MNMEFACKDGICEFLERDSCADPEDFLSAGSSYSPLPLCAYVILAFKTQLFAMTWKCLNLSDINCSILFSVFNVPTDRHYSIYGLWYEAN